MGIELTRLQTKLLLHATGAARVDQADVLQAAGYSQGAVDVAAEALQKHGLAVYATAGEKRSIEATDEGHRLARKILGEDAAT